MSSKIIRVDFDETIGCYSFPFDYREVPDAIYWLKRLTGNGARFILWTERTGPLLDAAVAWCGAQGVQFWGINASPEQTPFTSFKAHADLDIDNLNFRCPLIPGPFGKPQADWKIIGPEVEEWMRS